MRQTKRASKKRGQLPKEAQDTETRIERLYQDAATTGFKAMSRHSVGEFNDGFRQIAEEMNSDPCGRWSKYFMRGRNFSTPDHFGRFLSFRRSMFKKPRMHMRLTSMKSLGSGKCIWM